MHYIEAKSEVEPFNIAIIKSRFNQIITQQLYLGAIQRLEALEFPDDLITVAEVPGAVEIPLIAKQFAKTGRFDAIITLGAVIRGETTHYDYVCQQVSHGCQQVALEYNLPVVFGILTTENVEQAKQRVGGTHGHKGVDCVDCAIEMVNLLRQI